METEEEEEEEMIYFQGFSRKIKSIFDNITVFAIVRLIEWETWEHDFNLGYNPKSYPLFSVLWLYFIVENEFTIHIKNCKKNCKIYEVKPNFPYN